MKLFISYRRKSWPFTHRLAEQLGKLVQADIFIDYKGVDETDFERSILKHLDESDAVLVVVSEHTFAKERIEKADDWVRREIAGALQRDKPTVLCCVDGLTPPAPLELPEDIRAITRMQGISFYPDYFDAAVVKLAEFVGKVTPLHNVPPSKPIGPLLANKSTLEQAIHLLDMGDFDKAIFLLTELKDAGFKSRFINLDEVLAQAISQREAAVRDREARIYYDEIATLASSRLTIEQARTAWTAFHRQYPDYRDDHENLGARLRPTGMLTAPVSIYDGDPMADFIRTMGFDPSMPHAPTITADQRDLIKALEDIKSKPPVREESGKRLALLDDPRPGVGLRDDGVPNLAWCEVPSGSFIFQKDMHIELGTYFISKFPITHAQYYAFLTANDGFYKPDWWVGFNKPVLNKPNWHIPNHPIEGVNWFDAIAFCRWLSTKSGYEIRLPTEQEWEKAARGAEGYLYPWGQKYISGYANIDEAWSKVGSYSLKQTSTVGLYPQGVSPYGAMDMSGNVWEWCLTDYATGQNKIIVAGNRVVRGGSWMVGHNHARGDYRHDYAPDYRNNYVGFRVVTWDRVQ